MNIARTSLKFWEITVEALLANGDSAVISGVSLTLVPPGSGSPAASAVWLPATYANGVATILIAGPDHASPPAGTLVVSGVGSDLWARVVDAPEEDEHLVDLIRLI